MSAGRALRGLLPPTSRPHVHGHGESALRGLSLQNGCRRAARATPWRALTFAFGGAPTSGRRSWPWHRCLGWSTALRPMPPWQPALLRGALRNAGLECRRHAAQAQRLSRRHGAAPLPHTARKHTRDAREVTMGQPQPLTLVADPTHTYPPASADRGGCGTPSPTRRPAAPLFPGARAERGRRRAHRLPRAGARAQMHTAGTSTRTGWATSGRRALAASDRRWLGATLAPPSRDAATCADCTNAHDGEPAGRQYVVWPFYAFLDRHVRRGVVHALWHADFAQRRASGVAHDLITNLLAPAELAPPRRRVR